MTPIEPLEVLAIALILWAALYLVSRLLPLKKYNLEVHPLYLVYRTQRLNNILHTIASSHPKLWKVTFNISIAMGVGLTLLAVYFMTNNLINFLYAPKQAERVFLLIPGITISSRWFFYVMLAAGVAITTHEIAHGVASHLEGIPTKSAGIILALITFGGFVEPEEEKFKTSSLASRLRVITAGSMTNLVVGLLVLLLLIGLYMPPSGVVVEGVREGGPAFRGGIQSWDVIRGVNNTVIRDLAGLSSVVSKARPGDLFIFNTSNGVRSVIAEANPANMSRISLGLTELTDYYPVRGGWLGPSVSQYLYLTLNWLSLIGLSLGIFNMMPLYPLDGDAFLWALLSTWMKKGAKVVRIALSGVSLMLMVTNVGLSLIRYGFVPL